MRSALLGSPLDFSERKPNMNHRHVPTLDAALAGSAGVVARGMGSSRPVAGASRGLRKGIGAHF